MSVLLGAVRKNDREEIRVQLAEYEGVTVPPRLIETLLKAKNGEGS